MRVDASTAIDWSRSYEYRQWCIDHGFRPSDVLAIQFGVNAPHRHDEAASTRPYARVTAFERGVDGRLLVLGSRGARHLKQAKPQYVAVKWWPEAILSHHGIHPRPIRPLEPEQE